ncbi:hypothetical protein STEG23_025754 [Scotinomys teguina]
MKTTQTAPILEQELWMLVQFSHGHPQTMAYQAAVILSTFPCIRTGQGMLWQKSHTPGYRSMQMEVKEEVLLLFKNVGPGNASQMTRPKILVPGLDFTHSVPT